MLLLRIKLTIIKTAVLVFKHIRKINEFINEFEIYSLIDNIEEDCKYSSDTMDAYNHNSYKKIISIGNPALKYLIECLDRPSASGCKT